MALVIKRFFSAHTAFLSLMYPLSTLWAAALLAGAGAVFVLGISAFVGSLGHPSQGDVSLFESLYKAGSARAYAAPVASISGTSKVLEMHVANNGAIYIKGAVVTAVEGSVVAVSVAWGSAMFPWRIKLSSLTSVVLLDGKKITLSDLGVGDRVTITGTIKGDAAQPTIDAQSIRKN